MDQKSGLLGEAMSQLENYGRCISAAGIRLGSILYLGFGATYRVGTTRGALVDDYPAILEFGADRWHMIDDGSEVINSEFSDAILATKLLSNRLVGRFITRIDLSDCETTVRLDRDGLIKSYIEADPASGFLYHFRANHGPCWDTVDGLLPLNA